MSNPTLFRPWRPILLQPRGICRSCQQRAIRYQTPLRPLFRNIASSSVLRAAPKDVKDEPLKETKEETEFVPKPLGRPIGFREPPRVGENTGKKESRKKVEGATFRERQTKRTQNLVDEWGKSYFQDFKNIRKYRSGKVFLANPRIFKAEAALFFPNFHGYSLAEEVADTTPVLRGKVSVVNIYSSAWGEAQAKSFTGPKNKELQELLDESKDICQKIEINIEENSMKAWILAMFQWNLKRQYKQEDWGKYFIVRKGVSDLMRETLGMLNRRVGYVYLVDENLKIRWAGSGDAEGTESEDMVKGLRKLVQDARSRKEGRSANGAVRPVERVSEELEVQSVNAGAS